LISWAKIGLELGSHIASIYEVKLKRKYKEEILGIRSEIWKESNKPTSEQDHSKIDDLKFQESELKKLFYSEVQGAINDKVS